MSSPSRLAEDPPPFAASAHATSGAARNASLDTLRGIAIVFVVVAHVIGAYPAGDLATRALSLVGNQGVQLFFLVSAITMGLMWDARRTESSPRAKFYVRRFCRIAPLYWFAIVFYTWRWGAGGSEANASSDIERWIAVALNALFLHAAWPSAINSVVPGGWSIGVEMMFYAVFPWLAVRAAGPLMGLALAWYLAVGLGLETALAHAWPSLAGGTFLYYAPLTQAPVFLIGLVLYRTFWRGEPVSRVALLGVALSWGIAAFAARAAGLPGRPFFWLGVVLLAGVVAWVLRAGVHVRVLAALGRVSYSMYLFHFAVLWALRQTLPTLSFLFGLGLTLAGSALVAVLSQRTAEAWSQALGRAWVRRLDGAGRADRSVPAVGA